MCKLAFFWLLLFMPAIGIASFNEEPNASYPPEEMSTKKSLSSSYTEINLDLKRTHPVSPMLYGLFFEEVDFPFHPKICIQQPGSSRFGVKSLGFPCKMKHLLIL